MQERGLGLNDLNLVVAVWLVTDGFKQSGFKVSNEDDGSDRCEIREK